MGRLSLRWCRRGSRRAEAVWHRGQRRGVQQGRGKFLVAQLQRIVPQPWLRLPEQARHVGISYEQLVDMIVKEALA